jgi:hypothetical protein
LNPPIPTADPIAYLDNGLTLLHVALLACRPDCVKIILDSPSGIESVNCAVREGEFAEWSPLSLAIHLKDCLSIGRLIARGANPMVQQPPNACPIRMALESEVGKCVFEWLMDLRNDILQEWFRRPYLNGGSTPVEYFKGKGADEIAEMLEGFCDDGWAPGRPEAQRCKDCTEKEVKLCHICDRWFCTFHLRKHKHGEPVATTETVQGNV